MGMIDKIIDYIGKIGLLLFFVMLTVACCYGLCWLIVNAFNWAIGALS